MSELTRILCAIDQGEPHAAAQLLPLVYEELRQLAARKLAAEPSGQTLQPTALVHEAYLRLVEGEQLKHWNSRGHFFAAAAEAMRRILIETARRKQCLKHGGGKQRQKLHADLAQAPEPDENVMALDTALSQFAQRYPLQARLVELRYFAGLSGDEAASLLNISPSTADRHWVFARAWLRRSVAERDNSENS